MAKENTKTETTRQMKAVLAEAKRYLDAGLQVHLIEPGSKVPMVINGKPGWSTERKVTIEEIAANQVPGNGLGLLLGTKLPGDLGYLGNIDIDTKSTDERHKAEAYDFVKRTFSEELIKNAPMIKTGRGYRLTVRLAYPTAGHNLARSDETTDIKTGGKEMQKVAWEVDLMGKGRQVVVPPSLHMDTKEPYQVVKGHELNFSDLSAIPLLTEAELEELKAQRPESKQRDPQSPTFMVPVPIDDDKIAAILPDIQAQLECDPTVVENHSATLLSVCDKLVKARWNVNEILTLLTDRDNWELALTGFRHRKTEDRRNAADWVYEHTYKKAHKAMSAEGVFDDLPVETAPMIEGGAEVIKARARELDNRTWIQRVKRVKAPKGVDPSSMPPQKLLENVVTILQGAVGNNLFKRDEFAMRDTYGCDGPWTGGAKDKLVTDDDLAVIRLWLSEKFNFEVVEKTMIDAITVIAVRNGYHPVREELNALPPWDRVKRLDTWLTKHFGAQGPADYTAQVMRKWMVASVLRVFEPGAKFDWLPVLESRAQGTGKSTFGLQLVGERYFLDHLEDLKSRDAALGLQGIRCVEFGEMAKMKTNHIETIKAFITRRSDKVRPMYGRKWLDMPRQVVFLGSTNNSTYLIDEENRRFNPIVVTQLDFDALDRDRTQLWAEALHIYKTNGEPLMRRGLELQGHAKDFAFEIQKSKRASDESEPMALKIELWIKRQQAAEQDDYKELRLAYLFTEGGPLGGLRGTTYDHRMAAKALREIGYNEKAIKGYIWWSI